MNLALYQIADQYLADVQKLQDLDIDEQTFNDTLEGLSGDLEAKAVNVSMVIKNLEASALAIKEAEAAMAKRRKAIEAKADRIKEYLKENMARTGISKIESPYFVISIKNNPESLEVFNEAMIPAKYFVQPPIPAPVLDKNTLKADIKNGLEIDGARLTRGQRVEIK